MLLGVFLAIEIATVGFLVFWLAVGALFAMIVSFFTNSVLIQTTVFVVISSILIPLTKPFVDKYITKPIKPTNTDLLINKHAIVIKEINSINGTGQVKVTGEIWSATSEENNTIDEGTKVEVLKVDGVKLLVKKEEEKI